MRDAASGTQVDIRQVFGPETEDSAKFAGALSCTDARLLALPVRSFRGVFAYVTSPLLLTLAARGVVFTAPIADHGYGMAARPLTVRPGGEKSVRLRLAKSSFWYDFSVAVAGAAGYGRRFAGRVETGKPGSSDPLMGRVKLG